MRRDYPFSQRNKATKRVVRVEVGGKCGWGGGVGQNLKRGGRVGNIGGLHKIGGLGTHCQPYS